MVRLLVFIVLAVVILGSAVLSVTTKRIMRAATFLLFVLFGVAGIYERLHGGRLVAGAVASLVGLAMVVFVFFKEKLLTVASSTDEVPMKTIGHALMGSEKYQYVLPFEFISVFLLACIIGGILISRKE